MIAVTRTSRGLVRPKNEDSILVREPDLYAIADGMGGADAGEVASYEAVQQLARLDLSGCPGRKFLLPWSTASRTSTGKSGNFPRINPILTAWEPP